MQLWRHYHEGLSPDGSVHLVADSRDLDDPWVKLRAKMYREQGKYVSVSEPSRSGNTVFCRHCDEHSVIWDYSNWS